MPNTLKNLKKQTWTRVATLFSDETRHLCKKLCPSVRPSANNVTMSDDEVVASDVLYPRGICWERCA